jgi:hypothetical protein
MVTGVQRPKARADVGEPHSARGVVLFIAGVGRGVPHAFPDGSVFNHEPEPVWFNQPRLHAYHQRLTGISWGAIGAAMARFDEAYLNLRLIEV